MNVFEPRSGSIPKPGVGLANLFDKPTPGRITVKSEPIYRFDHEMKALQKRDLMKKMPLIIMMMLALCSAVSASTPNNKEGNEGIPDDPNHPGTVNALREDIRAEREMNMVYQMLIEAYDKNEEAIRKLKDAQQAWAQYRDAEFVSETALYAGGHPQQEKAALVSVEMTRERTARMKMMLNEMVNGEGKAPDTLQPRIKAMIEKLDKLQSTLKPKPNKKR